MIEYRYDAFISYNHAADGDLAPAIERGLERLAKPWYRLRALSVFRDVSDTGLNPSLWGTVQRQLDGSRWLVLLACPESAASPWVRREVAHWCDTQGSDRVLLVLTDGELIWDRDAGRFAEQTTALPPALAERFTSEPLHLDLRWTSTLGRPPSLADARFKTDMARLASPIRDLPPGEIESEDVRLHRKARRLARGAVAVLVTLAVIATVAGVIAVRNAHEAERRARQAVARQLGLAALDMPASELDRVLLVAAAAARLDPDAGPDRFLASRTLLGRHSRLVALLRTPRELGEPSVRGVAISPSGDVVAATVWPAVGAPRIVRWDRTSGDVTVEPLAETGGPPIAVTADGTTVVARSSTVATGPDGRVVVEADGGRISVIVLAADGSVVPVVAWDGGSAVASVTGERAAVAIGGVVHLVDVGAGVELASGDVAGSGPVDAVGVRGDQVVVATAGRVRWWRHENGRLEPAAPPVGFADVGEIRHVVVAESGSRALVVGALGTAVVDVDRVVTTEEATGGVLAEPTGRFVAVLGSRLSVWDLARGQRTLTVPEPVNAAAWSACDQLSRCRLVTAGVTVDVWEPAARRRIRLADQTNAQAVGITADGETVVSAGWGPSVAVWSLRLPIDDRGRETLSDAGALASFDPVTGTVARVMDDEVGIERPDGDTISIATGRVDELALTPGATHLVTATGGSIAVHDDAGADVALDPRCRTGRWALSPSGRWLAVHDPDTRQTALCDLAGGAPVAGFGRSVTAATAESIAVDDDGAVAFGAGGLVEYRPLVDGVFARVAEAVSVGYADEAVTVDRLSVRNGRVAAAVTPSGGGLARVLVWDARRRGTPVQFETDHTQLAAVGLLGADAGLLAVAGRFGDGATVVQVWEAETRRQLGRGLGGLGTEVRSLSGDATAVIAGDADGRTFRWPLDLDPRREVCAIVGRDLTDDDWDSDAGRLLARYDRDPVCADP